MGANRAGSGGSHRQLRVHVDVASAAMLRLLCQLQISKGAMSLERPSAVRVGTRLEVVLVLTAGKTSLAATVRSCVPQGAHFLVSIALDEIGEAQRSAIGRLAGL